MGKFIDITGQVFNLLTAIEPAGKNKYNNTLWKCRCICGNEIIRLGSELTRNKAAYSCGCTKKNPNKIIRGINHTGPVGLPPIPSGFRVGKLTVIKRQDKFTKLGKKVGSVSYLCKCDCGNDTVATATSLVNGKIKSCGCLIKDLIIERANLNYELSGGKTGAFRQIVNIYKGGAVGRGLQWDLSDEFVWEIMQRNCRYCDTPPCNTRKINLRTFVHNGIDRVDNNKGYVQDNVVPCCTNCNMLKIDMTEIDFFNKIKDICINLKLNEKA